MLVGHGKYLITYCKNRNVNKYDVVVVLPKDSLLIPELETTGVKIVEIDGLKDNSKDYKAYKLIKKVIDDEKPNIVHTHASLIARIAAKRSQAKPKIVYTKHCDFEPSKIYKYGVVKRMFGSFTKTYADCIIATSAHSKENLVKQGIDPNIITFIPNGTDGYKRLDESKIAKLKEKYSITNEKVIGYVARLVELKGHKTLFDAVKILKGNEKLNFKCLIVGDGEYKEALQEYVKEIDIEDKVIFTGFIKNVEEIVNILDVQVNCSYLSETTNLALLEGMSIGVPTVATNIGGTPDMIENDINGYIVPILDSENMAQKIECILRKWWAIFKNEK